MDEFELNDLITRAKNLIGGVMPVDSENCEFAGYKDAISISESGSPKSFEIKGILKSPSGHKHEIPLKKIVQFLESQKQ